MADNLEWASALAIVIAGLTRFANEGYVSWSQENAAKLFHPYSLGDPRVRRILDKWHQDGAIRLSGTEDEFMRVLDLNYLEVAESTNPG